MSIRYSYLITALAGMLFVGTGFAQTDIDGISESFGAAIATGCRQWDRIAPTPKTGALDELRGIVRNEVGRRECPGGTRPVPKRAVLVRRPVDEARQRTCFTCRQAHAQGHNFVFTRWAP